MTRFLPGDQSRGAKLFLDVCLCLSSWNTQEIFQELSDAVMGAILKRKPALAAAEVGEKSLSVLTVVIITPRLAAAFTGVICILSSVNLREGPLIPNVVIHSLLILRFLFA